jgi:tetratricopeptide (TPR) repeat protein
MPSYPGRYVELHGSCLTNAAQCALKLAEYADAVDFCTQALDTSLEECTLPDALRAKALYRRGTARLKQSEFEKARADLRAACQLEPKSREIRAAYAAVGEAEKATRQAEKARYAGALDRDRNRAAPTMPTPSGGERDASGGAVGGAFDGAAEKSKPPPRKPQRVVEVDEHLAEHLRGLDDVQVKAARAEVVEMGEKLIEMGDK